eukprot:2064917-Rhodomonas_salina.1
METVTQCKHPVLVVVLVDFYKKVFWVPGTGYRVPPGTEKYPSSGNVQFFAVPDDFEIANNSSSDCISTTVNTQEAAIRQMGRDRWVPGYPGSVVLLPLTRVTMPKF